MAPALSKVAAGSSFQPPKAASEPDCTAKYADAADCSDKVMAAQCGNGQVMCFSQKCCLCATAGGRPANAPSRGYGHHKRWAETRGPPLRLSRPSDVRGLPPHG